MKPFKFTTGASTNLTKVSDSLCAVKGLSACNTQGAPIFLKLYWFKASGSATAPTVGTTVPDVTIGIPMADADMGASGVLLQEFSSGLVARDGVLWLAVTAGMVDTDTANVSANSVITLFLE